MPASGSPTKPSRGFSAVMRPRAEEPWTVWWSRTSPSQSSKRSAKRSWIIGPYSTSSNGSPIGDEDSRSESFVHELVVDRLVHDRRAQRRAALARGAEAAEQGALDGEVDVGVVHHDHRVLAAELQARRLQVTPAEPADLAADGRRPGEADLVDQALLQRRLEPREGVGTRRLHDVQHAAGHAAGVEELDPARRPARRCTPPASRRRSCRTGSPARGTRPAPRRGSCRR